jgi:hypothetical protein
MCSTCGSKTYGQDQPEARTADKERIEKVLSALKKKNSKGN